MQKAHLRLRYRRTELKRGQIRQLFVFLACTQTAETWSLHNHESQTYSFGVIMPATRSSPFPVDRVCRLIDSTSMQSLDQTSLTDVTGSRCLRVGRLFQRSAGLPLSRCLILVRPGIGRYR